MWIYFDMQLTASIFDQVLQWSIRLTTQYLRLNPLHRHLVSPDFDQCYPINGNKLEDLMALRNRRYGRISMQNGVEKKYQLPLNLEKNLECFRLNYRKHSHWNTHSYFELKRQCFFVSVSDYFYFLIVAFSVKFLIDMHSDRQLVQYQWRLILFYFCYFIYKAANIITSHVWILSLCLLYVLRQRLYLLCGNNTGFLMHVIPSLKMPIFFWPIHTIVKHRLKWV